MNRPALISIAALALAVGVGTAAVFASGAISSPDRDDVQVTAPTPVVTPTDQPEGLTPTPAAVPTTPTAAPTPSATPTPTGSELPSSDIAGVQQRLTELGYYVGAIDGVAGPATASAVQAFQKVQRLTADGVIGPNTVAALDSPTIPQLRGGPADRVEVDLDRQVLYLVEDGALSRILPISSGSGESYSNPGGGTARSLTPVGDFRVERHISGERNAPLGTLYDPMYFHGGWAIHGSNSVPAYPASHGCVRVTRADARWLFDRVPIGLSVSVYGNTNAFSPSLGESAGTSTPAGDTAQTTPDDGIQTEEPAPPPAGPSAPGPTTPGPTTPQPTTPTPTTPAPTTPEPTTPAPTTPPPTTPPPSSEPPSSEPTPPPSDAPEPQTRPDDPAADQAADQAADPAASDPDQG